MKIFGSFLLSSAGRHRVHDYLVRVPSTNRSPQLHSSLRFLTEMHHLGHDLAPLCGSHGTAGKGDVYESVASVHLERELDARSLGMHV